MKRDYIRQVFTDLDKLKTDGIWFSGIKGEGEFKIWYTGKQLDRHCFYKNGKLDGELKHWHENGELWRRCFYKNGMRDGEHKEWFRNTLSIHRLYKNDKIIKDYLG